jgi:CcmD family protein
MRLRIVVLWLLLLAGSGASAAQPPKDFVPVDAAPEGEQIPAMPLLGAAYGFIWVGLLGYVWSIARRLHHVEAELADLESRKK